MIQLPDHATGNRGISAWPWRIALTTIAAAVYLGIPGIKGETLDVPGHFPTFARAFAHGQLGIPVGSVANLRIDELIPENPESVQREGESRIRIRQGDKLYLGYPPLPAVLLIPFVLLLGDVKVQIACRVMSIVNVLVFDACLTRIHRPLGWGPLRPSARAALVLFFAFGTAVWHNSLMAGDWQYAHAVALGGCLLALHEFCGPNRPLVVGHFIALVGLTRPTAALACLFFVLPLLRAGKWPELAQLGAAPCAAVAGLCLYNQVRFGDPMDFGYSRMFLTGAGRVAIETHGKFAARFIPRNFFWFFLAPPWPARGAIRCPIAYDPRGLSLFIASPACIYALIAAWRGRARPLVQDAVLSIVFCLIPLLAYYNAGFWQFGHRFSMDYLAVLMPLVVIGAGSSPGRLAYSIMIASILIQAVGVLIDPSIYQLLPDWLAPSP